MPVKVLLEEDWGDFLWKFENMNIWKYEGTRQWKCCWKETDEIFREIGDVKHLMLITINVNENGDPDIIFHSIQ